jgi:hypothetical protein
MSKIKNPETLKIAEEFKNFHFQYKAIERIICHLLSIKKLTKAKLLQIAKEMKEEKLISPSRNEQRYSHALKIWLCRNKNLVYIYLINMRLENDFLDFPLENTKENLE